MSLGGWVAIVQISVLFSIPNTSANGRYTIILFLNPRPQDTLDVNFLPPWYTAWKFVSSTSGSTTSTLLTCFMNSKESALAISSTLLKSPSLGNDERRAPSQVSLLLWLDFPPMKRIVNVMFLCKLIACFKLSTFLFPLWNDPDTRNTGGFRWSTNESPTMAGGKKEGTTKLLCLGVKKKMLVVFSSLGSSSWQMMIKLTCCKCEKTTIVEQN